MRYRPLGPSGLLVSELALGTATFGGTTGMWQQFGGLGLGDAEALIKTAVDAGINLIDTANVYADGESERMLGAALRNLGLARGDLVIASKVMAPMGPGPNDRGASRGHILDQAKASLRRLQLDYLDLYQVHGFDPVTPIVETLEALDQLVRHGHVRYVGLSNWAAWQVVRAIGITEARRLAPILSLQAYYSLVGRGLEREIGPMLTAEGRGLLVWSPLASGLLSGKYADPATPAQGRRTTIDFPPVDPVRAETIIGVLRTVAAAHGVSPARIAVAWLLHQPVVTSVVLGATRTDQLLDTIAAAEVRLTGKDLAALDEVSRLPPEYPGWMLKRQAGYRTLTPAGTG